MTGRAVDPAWLARVLEMAGIAEHRGTKYGLLDPCTQRLVDCAVALLQGPRVAIAAEPTAGPGALPGSPRKTPVPVGIDSVE